MQCCGCSATAAQDKTPCDLDGIRIGCPHCGLYDTSGSVLELLLRFPMPERAEALVKAKRFAASAEIPHIDARREGRLRRSLRVGARWPRARRGFRRKRAVEQQHATQRGPRAITRAVPLPILHYCG